MERIRLKGIKVSEFIHRDEERLKQGVMSSHAVQSVLKKASDMSIALMAAMREGRYVQVDEKSAPELINIIKETCEILDYNDMPDVYMCHSPEQIVTACGTDDIFLVISDYTLKTYDEGMLRYAIGNAVAMIKAGHVEVSTLGAYVPSGLLINIAKIKFIEYLHAADITSDRGGLLACQSFADAARCQLFELGMPPEVTRTFFTNDDEAVRYVKGYIEAAQTGAKRYEGLIINAARVIQNVSYIEAPANRTLSELYDWYTDADGYGKIIKKYSKAVSA